MIIPIADFAHGKYTELAWASQHVNLVMLPAERGKFTWWTENASSVVLNQAVYVGDCDPQSIDDIKSGASLLIV